ncbi:MAG: iron ABC transporter permease [Gammaproteobacteria bacterium]|nr:iron ABC transporter permease [Gammaproteobacteria bacterium]
MLESNLPQRHGSLTHAPPWGVVLTLLLAGVLILPVIVVAASVFLSSGDIWQHLYDTVLAEYIGNSLLLALGVGCLSLPLGVIPAWLVTMYRFPGSRQLEWALLLPLAMPAYIIAYTYTGMLDVAGPLQSWLRAAFDWQYGDYWFPDIRSLPGAVLMLSLVLYPYIYLLARAAFLEQSASVVEVARTLGVRPAAAFFKVVLPLARPAIIVGLSLVLMETLADYGTVQYFGVATFTTGIFKTWFGLGSSIAAAQLSALLMLFVLFLIILEQHSRRQSRYYDTSTRYGRLEQKHLRGLRGLPALAVCALPVLFGFVIPSGQLLLWGIQTWRTSLDAGFFTLIANSIELALVTAVLAAVLALAISYARRQQPGIMTNLFNRLLGMGYAVPGAVIAVGVLIPFTWLDRHLGHWFGLLSDTEPGLLLSGTIAILVFAYLVRFLALSLNTVDAGLAKIKPSMDEAGRSLGFSGFRLLRRVHIPILRGSLLTAVLLVFVDVLKELPATLILRPFNFNTLAVRTYELANEERLADAAFPALAIVLAGIIPVIILSRAISQSRTAHA